MSRRPGRPYAGGPDLRLKLVEAGTKVFAERGYASASARDIVGLAGVTAPVLYHHFGNKAGLFAAVVEDVNDQVLSRLEDAIEGKEDLLARIDAVLDVLEDFARVNPAMARFVIAAPIEFARHPELAAAAPQMARLSEFVHRMCDGSEAQGMRRDQAEGLVLTVIYGISRMAASPGTPKHAARHVETAVTALRSALRGQFFTQAPGQDGSDPGPVKRRRAARR